LGLLLLLLLLLLLFYFECIFYFSWSKYCKEWSEFLLPAVISLNIVLLAWSGMDGKIERKRVKLMRMLRLR